MSTGMGSPRGGMWGELGAVCPCHFTTRRERCVRGWGRGGKTPPFPVPSQTFPSLLSEITGEGESWGPGQTERGGRSRKASLPGGGILPPHPFSP